MRACAVPSSRRAGRACRTTTSSARSSAGTGEGAEATHFDEIVYEGYAPGGVAVIVDAATDNKNRTAAELRRIFSKNHGNLGTSGSVSYMFHKKGRITVPREAIDEETSSLSWPWKLGRRS